MSLTRHVANRRSPIRAFFDERLPGSQRVAIRANRELRGARRRHGRTVELHLPKVPPFPCRAGADPRLTGTALDLLVRSTLGAEALSDTAATRGAGILTYGPDGRKSALLVERDVVARIRALRPWEASLDAPACRELASLCVLLARFEQVRRAPPETAAALKRELADVPLAIQAYVRALVRDVDVDDVANVARSAADDHADLRQSHPLVFGPVFARSRDLGGADADLIAGDLLLDIKATSMPKIVTRPVLLQLIGYALADTEDRYGIRRVGVTAVRWRTRWIVELDDLLEEMAGVPFPATALREQFAEVVESVRSSRRPRPRAEPPARTLADAIARRQASHGKEGREQR